MPAAALAKPPTTAAITAAREHAGLTKTQAGALLHTNYRTWQQWEVGERKMHPAFWELFLLKASGQGSRKGFPLKS